MIILSIFLYTLSLIITFLFYKFPPKDINWKYGYRTNLSTKNIYNWNYANKIAPPIMMKTLSIGFLCLLVLIFLLRDIISFDTAPIFIGFYIVINALLILPIVEFKLKLYDKTNSN
jgi:uncharacterized membrane protein